MIWWGIGARSRVQKATVSSQNISKQSQHSMFWNAGIVCLYGRGLSLFCTFNLGISDDSQI